MKGAAMSELENIVHHIVQHEEERQAEKIKLESEIKALEEVLEHGISTKFVEDEVIYVYSPKTAHDMREKLEENYKQLHAQLTIPKSIADELKGAIGATNFESTPYSIKLDEDGYLKMWASLRNKKLSEQAYKFCWNNTRVFDTYLNPLTRDLVKVVEG